MKIVRLYNNGDNFITHFSKYLDDSWSTDFLEALSDTYFLVHSGNKTVSPFGNILLEQSYIVDDDNNYVTDDDGNILINNLDSFNDNVARIIVAQFSTNWLSIRKALTIDYDLENIETTNFTDKPNLKETIKNSTDITETTNNDDKNNYQGFNATDYTPVTQSDNNSTTTTKGDKDKNTSEREQTGTRTTTRSKTGGDVDERIQARLKLRNENVILYMVKDIDKLMSLPVYDLDNV